MCYIPISINEEEILVRFIFCDNFKKKIISSEKIIPENIFLDTRLCGISLQRHLYCDENSCKSFAKKIPKDFIGFILFKKKDFVSVANRLCRI